MCGLKCLDLAGQEPFVGTSTQEIWLQQILLGGGKYEEGEAMKSRYWISIILSVILFLSITAAKGEQTPLITIYSNAPYYSRCVINYCNSIWIKLDDNEAKGDGFGDNIWLPFNTFYFGSFIKNIQLFSYYSNISFNYSIDDYNSLNNYYFRNNVNVSSSASSNDWFDNEVFYYKDIYFSLNADAKVTFMGSGRATIIKNFNTSENERVYTQDIYLYDINGNILWARGSGSEEGGFFFEPFYYQFTLPKGEYWLKNSQMTKIHTNAWVGGSGSAQSEYKITFAASRCNVFMLTPPPPDDTNTDLDLGKVNTEKLHSDWQADKADGLLKTFLAALSAKAGATAAVTSGYRTCEYQRYLYDIIENQRRANKENFTTKHPDCVDEKTKADQLLKDKHIKANSGAFDPYNSKKSKYAPHVSGTAIDVNMSDLMKAGLTEAKIREVLKDERFKDKIKWGRDLYPNAPTILQNIENQKERHHFELAVKLPNPCLSAATQGQSKAMKSANSSWGVEVKVRKEFTAEGVNYFYTVANNSSMPLKALYIGYDASTGDNDLYDFPLDFSDDNYAPPNSFFSPMGWQGMVLDVLDTPYYNLFWQGEEEGVAVPPGKTLAGFKVILPQEAAGYDEGHFTAILDDGAQGVEVSGPLSNASSILFERGLPVFNYNLASPSNLNGTSNPNRSNFSQSFQYTATQPTTYQIAGDDFTLGNSGQTYQVDKIRVWMIYGVASSQYDAVTLPAPPVPLKLWLGQEGGPIQALTATPTLTRVWYSDGSNYQRTSDGNWRGIWQVDFPVNLKIRGGRKYQYFLDGLFKNVSGLYQSPSLCTAKAALSNNPQDGTNDQCLALTLVNGTPSGVPNTVSGIDANVQIFGKRLKPSPGPAINLLLSTE
jgi:hypothetical protein